MMTEPRGSLTTMLRLVSSAKSLIDEFNFSTISLMNAKNNIGPRIDPRGIPVINKRKSDENLRRTTCCFLSLR